MSKNRIKIEKLVRDHIPEILRNQGMVVQERILEHEEFLSKLKDKLEEEAGEVQQANTLAELTEELADVLEVLLALSSATGISWEQIETKRLEKRIEKGGFDKRVYVVYRDPQS